jgi:hypothetical protein
MIWLAPCTATVTFHSLAQCGLQLLQHAHIARQIGQAPLELERILEPAQIARRVVHVGRLDLDVMQADHRVDLDVVRLGRLAHDLAVHLAVRRNVDDPVAQNLGPARQAPAGRQRLGPAVFLLDRGHRRDMVGTRTHAVLGELALGHQHLAAPAQAAPAAH